MRARKARRVAGAEEVAEAGGGEPWECDAVQDGSRVASLVALVAQDVAGKDHSGDGSGNEEEEHESGEGALWMGLLLREGGGGGAGRDEGSEALEQQQEQPVTALLQGTCSEHPWSPLHVALMVGDLDAARGLVEWGRAKLAERGGCSARTPLMAALRGGQLQCARWVWRKLSAAERTEQTSGAQALKLLGLAVRSGQVGVLEWTAREVVNVGAALARDQVGRDQMYKLLTSVFTHHLADVPRVRCLRALCNCQVALSMGLSAAAMKQCPAAIAALVTDGGALLPPDHAYLLECMPPGSYVGMMRSLLDVAGRSSIHVDGVRLLLAAVVVGAPELMEMLLGAGALSDLHQSNASGDPFWAHPLWAACLGVPDGTHPSCWSRIKVGTDHSVQMARLLLKAGASPFLVDARGHTLLDALWCGWWWSGGESRARHHPAFELAENRLRLCREIQLAQQWWSPVRHRLFPERFRLQVRTFLLCNIRERRRGRGRLALPRVLVELIVSWLAIASFSEDATRPQTRSALMALTVPHLKGVLEEHGLARRDTGKARKTELVDLALRAKEADAEAARRQQRAAEALPPVVGRLEALETRSGAVFSLDIVNPAVQPWINIGRSFIKHPKGGATLDLDLSGVEFNRRISRLHATLRYNVQERDWELQVRGRNGVEIDRGGMRGPEMIHPGPEWLSLSKVGLSFRMPFANLQFTLIDKVPTTSARPPEEQNE